MINFQWTDNKMSLLEWKKLNAFKWKWVFNKGSRFMTRGMGRNNDPISKTLPWMWENVKRWVPNIPKWESFWQLKFRSISNFWDESANNKHDPFIETPYNIGNISKCKYWKSVCILHLEPWPISYMTKRRAVSEINIKIND